MVSRRFLFFLLFYLFLSTCLLSSSFAQKDVPINVLTTACEV